MRVKFRDVFLLKKFEYEKLFVRKIRNVDASIIMFAKFFSNFRRRRGMSGEKNEKMKYNSRENDDGNNNGS